MYRGRDGFITLLRSASKVWSSLQLLPGPVIASQERLVATGEYIFKTGSAAGVIRMPFVHLWKVPGGLLTEIWLYFWDTAALLAYLKGTPFEGQG